jgi:hypothetical protein
MKEAVLVVGNANNVGAGEEELQAILEDDLGFFVSIVDDDDDFRDVVDRQFQGLIIISDSVQGNNLDNGYINARIPTLVMDDDAFPEFEMTDDDAQDARTLNARELNIIDETHPLATGLGGRGRIDITRDQDNQTITVGRPDPRTAKIVVGANNSRLDAAVFVYEPNAELARVDNNRNTSIAAHRRVGIFVRENLIEDLDVDAQRLLENAIIYTWSGAVNQ